MSTLFMRNSLISCLCGHVGKNQVTCLSPDLYWVARTWGWSQPHLELCEGCIETGSFSELRSLWIWAKTGAYHSQFLFLSSIDQCLLKEEEGEGEVAQSCPTLCDPVDCSLPGFSVHGILQARILEWFTISFSRGSFQPRDRTRVSRIADRCFTLWATREAPYLAQSLTWSRHLIKKKKVVIMLD